LLETTAGKMSVPCAGHVVPWHSIAMTSFPVMLYVDGSVIVVLAVCQVQPELQLEL